MSKKLMYLLHGIPIKLYKDSLSIEEVQSNIELLECLKVLYAFIRPLNVELALGCQDLEYLYFSSECRLSSPVWYLYADTFPAGVEVEIQEGVQTSMSSRIVPESIIHWVNQALNQSHRCPEPYTLSWRLIEITSVQAYIPDISISQQSSLEVIWKSKTFNYPIHEEENKKWIAGPMTNPNAIAPFYIQISQDYGAINLHLEIYMSLWTNSDFSAYASIQNTISSLIKRGWKLSYLPDNFGN